MKLLAAIAIFATFLATGVGMERPSFHTKGTVTNKRTGTLAPGEYWWNDKLSPAGPVVVLISIPQQTAHVYRNGILIGRSSVSTGTQGNATPGGVFSILEKKQTHRSKKYDNAPMPNMQRLTWTGIAMHSGNLPGYPASHGCIRMPYDFSQLLFGVTSSGGTVVVGNGKTPVPHLASDPGSLLAPKDLSADMLRPLTNDDFDWKPERSTTGPVSIVMSSADRAIYVYRNGNVIGRAAMELTGRGALGNQTFTLLSGDSGRASRLAPGRQAGRWMRVDSQGRGPDAEAIAERLIINPTFAAKVYDTLSPGATVIVTDQPVVRKRGTAALFES